MFWGHTLAYLYRLLQARQPASLRTCIMVRKKRPSVKVPVDYLGFEIPDVWVVGYGLDYADRYRTLSYIAELKDLAGAIVTRQCGGPAARRATSSKPRAQT
jgi:hypoxanthine phosphoribosyltransferase